MWHAGLDQHAEARRPEQDEHREDAGVVDRRPLDRFGRKHHRAPSAVGAGSFLPMSDIVAWTAGLITSMTGFGYIPSTRVSTSSGVTAAGSRREMSFFTGVTLSSDGFSVPCV